MDREALSKIFHWDRCEECGECLLRCRYMELTREEAIAEIKRINRGETSTILQYCISCSACNAFCKNQAHPYERIIYGWYERYQREGLPVRASYLLPGRRPNFREDLQYSSAERALHEKWRSPDPPARVVLYPGCNLLSMPLLLTGQIFEKLPVWGHWDLCCGEMYYRCGIFDATAETARNLTEFYRRKEIDEMVFLCPAGYNMFSNILPKFGARFSFRITSFADWLTGELERGTFRITERLSGSAVVHDSCHARVLGRAFMDSQRKLLERVGLGLFETPMNREEGLCCGMASGARRFSALDLIRYSLRQLIELDRADGDIALAYCTGCLLMLSSVRPLKPFGKKLVHLLEPIRMALGETVPRTNMKRARSILGGIACHSLPFSFSRKTFRLSDGATP